MEREKPKTYMLRLYPDSASDQILINYLKEKRNVQQYLKQLVEEDIKNKNIVKTIREVMEEYFQTNRQEISQSYLQSEGENNSSPIIKKDDEREDVFVTEKIIENEVLDDEDEVESIPPEAFAFLEGLGQ